MSDAPRSSWVPIDLRPAWEALEAAAAAEDGHLEADYEDHVGQYDDDPNPYHGTYSEE